MWLYVRETSASSFWVVAGIATSVLLTLLAFSQPLVAQSRIDALICGIEGATVAIESPVSDSVVATADVPLSGSVSNANQIEVRVNGTYDKVIPLSGSQTSFASTVNLAEGTSTISIIAYDICGVMNASDAAVITYDPPPEPVSPGGGSSGDGQNGTGGSGAPVTSVDTSGGQGGVVISPATEVNDPLNQRDGDRSVFDSMSATLLTILDADAYEKNGLLLTIARFSLMVTGLALMFLSVPLLFLIRRRREEQMEVEEYITGNHRAVSIYHGFDWQVWLARFVGLILIIIAILI